MSDIDYLENQQNNNISEEKDGSIVVKTKSGSIHCMSIIGQIEGHYISPENQKATNYEHIIPLLAAIEENEETDGLLVMFAGFILLTALVSTEHSEAVYHASNLIMPIIGYFCAL